MKDELDKLAVHYQGKIQFAFINSNDEDSENLRISYWAYKPPSVYYIDPETKTAYAFSSVPKFETTKNWIEDKKYLKSPLQFHPVPFTVSDFPGM